MTGNPSGAGRQADLWADAVLDEEIRAPTFEAPSNFADNYGQRMRALLIPPTTGSYVFWIAGDDGSALFLSTDEDPAHRVRIATVNSWTSSRQWTKETTKLIGAAAFAAMKPNTMLVNVARG